MTIQQLIDSLKNAVEKGWIDGEDVVVSNYWTHDDALLQMNSGFENYASWEKHIASREIWAGAAKRLEEIGDVDNEMVRNIVFEEIQTYLEKGDKK